MNNTYNNMYQDQILNNQAVNITKLIFIPTKQYNEVYRRPFEVNATANTLTKLENVVGQSLSKGSNISPIAIAQNVPELFKMSDVPTDQIQIANGWGTVRLRFLMEVESDMGNSKYISYIQGYTDYHDPSMLGTIDPKMPMHINSITNTIRTVNAYNEVTTRVHSSFNVLYDPFTSGYHIENTTNVHRLLRPKDVADGIETNSIYEPGVTATDTRSIFNDVPLESKRLNNIGAKHVSEVINSHISAREMADFGHDEKDVLDAASAASIESNLQDVPFIEALSSLTGMIGTVSFDLEKLNVLKPDLESVLMIIDDRQLVGDVSNLMLETNITEQLSTVSVESTIANTLSESITGLLVDEMLSTIDFSVTNMTPNSEIIFTVSNVKSFIHGLDITLYVDRFLNKLRTLIMPGITQNNMLGVDIHVHSDILGDTSIGVSLNNNPPIIFRLPTFCNSLYTSMVGSSEQYNNVVEDYDQILQMTNIK